MAKQTNGTKRLKEAYALNLCTVSVSQIVEYQDLYIMEQEYDTILNNLNLEEMPKDEALLSILKQILDVITFFRMQDGDKKMIEAEYQHKMKNAIWSAVPNISGFVGNTPASAVASLAMQVGVGYMNYRKQKAENQLEHEKEMWKLQRSAIEQLNALRRELFDTAWRLADAYRFPDEYRLTERQIKRYNEILMDTDPLKRYERLEYIQEDFEAYPPFDYQMGHAASEVYHAYKEREELVKESDPNLGDECAKTAKTYREKAKEHYGNFLAKSKHNLLREDQLKAACALEKFDILRSEKSEENGTTVTPEMEQLLGDAVKNAAGAYDVIQLCALNYLNIKKVDEAKKELNMLINEQYNTELNAQILSRLYIEDKNDDAHSKHRILDERVGAGCLYPWPNPEAADAEGEFLSQQKAVLSLKFASVIQEIIEENTVKYNRKMRYSIDRPENEMGDDYFSDYPEQLDIRLMSAQNACKKYGDNYLTSVSNSIAERLDALNDLCRLIESFPGGSGKNFFTQIGNELSQEGRKSVLTNSIKEENLECVIKDLSFSKVTKVAFINLADNVKGLITQCNDMSEISQLETSLLMFCNRNQYRMPDQTIRQQNSGNTADLTMDLRRFMGQEFEKYQKELQQKGKMLEKVNAAKEKIFIKTGKKSSTKLYTYDDPKFNDYFKSGRFKDKKDRAVAVIDDQSIRNDDLILTTTEIYKAYKGESFKDNLKVKNLFAPIAVYSTGKTLYRMLNDTKNYGYNTATLDSERLTIGEDHIRYDDINMAALKDLLCDLNAIAEDYHPELKNTDASNVEGQMGIAEEILSKLVDVDYSEKSNYSEEEKNKKPDNAIKFSVSKVENADHANTYRYHLTKMTSAISLQPNDKLIFHLKDSRADGMSITINSIQNNFVKTECTIEEEDIKKGFFTKLCDSNGDQPYSGLGD